MFFYKIKYIYIYVHKKYNFHNKDQNEFNKIIIVTISVFNYVHIVINFTR